jgi:hypothetical protein
MPVALWAIVIVPILFQPFAASQTPALAKRTE